MNYRIRHLTRYTYGERVQVSLNQVCLQPRETPYQARTSFRLEVQPRPATWSTHTDYFGNQQAIFTLNQPHQAMEVRAESVMEVRPRIRTDLADTPAWETVRNRLPQPRDPAALEAYQYVFASPFIPVGPAFVDYARPLFTPGRPLGEAALALTRRIQAEFTYDPRATHLGTPVRDVLQNRRGVCQDFAQLEVACLRSLGLAARYVSGYLRTLPPPGQPRLVGADASHAWIAVWLDEAGWLELDPTNGCRVDQDHITVGWGRDYFDVTPVRGVILGGGQQGIQVSVDVQPLDAEGETKP